MGPRVRTNGLTSVLGCQSHRVTASQHEHVAVQAAASAYAAEREQGEDGSGCSAAGSRCEACRGRVMPRFTIVQHIPDLHCKPR